MAIEKYNDWRSIKNINEGLFRKSGEEKEEKMKRRAERKEDKFLKSSDKDMVDTGEFNVKAFRKSLESTKSLINSLLIDAKTRTVAGNKAAEGYVKTFRDYLFRISQVLGEVDYQIKRKGKELDPVDDAELIKGFKSIYIKLRESIDKSAESYRIDGDKAAVQALSDLEFKDITDLLNSSIKHFSNANDQYQILQDALLKEIKELELATQNKPEDKKTEGEVSNAPKIKAPITRASVKGKRDETVKYVQKSFLDIYAPFPKVTATDLYKRAKGFGVEGKWGDTTSDIVNTLKAGINALKEFKDKDLGGKDTFNQTFLDGIEAMKKALAPKKESLEPTSTIKTFESFLVKKNRLVNEEGDVDAIIAAVTASAGGEAGDSEEEPKVVVKKKDVVKALKDATPKVEAKVEVKVDDVDELMDKAVKYAKEEIKLEDAKKALQKIKGVKITNDFDPSYNYTYYPGGYSDAKRGKEKYAPTMKGQKEGGTPFATCIGMKFFRNGLCIVTYSGELGFYDASTGYYSIYTGKKTYWRESIKDLIANKGVPRKYRYLTKELVSMFSTFTRDSTITKFFKTLSRYDKSTVNAIFKAGKYLMKEKGVDLLVELRELAQENPEAKKFYYKNKESLKKLV